MYNGDLLICSFLSSCNLLLLPLSLSLYLSLSLSLSIKRKPFQLFLLLCLQYSQCYARIHHHGGRRHRWWRGREVRYYQTCIYFNEHDDQLILSLITAVLVALPYAILHCPPPSGHSAFGSQFFDDENFILQHHGRGVLR